MSNATSDPGRRTADDDCAAIDVFLDSEPSRGVVAVISLLSLRSSPLTPWVLLAPPPSYRSCWYFAYFRRARFSRTERPVSFFARDRWVLVRLARRPISDSSGSGAGQVLSTRRTPPPLAMAGRPEDSETRQLGGEVSSSRGKP